MMAMQYTIQLPCDFTAGKVRERVKQRAALFDSLPGLYHKSFLFNEMEHLYAPFYIWGEDSASRKFLLNDLFRGVTDAFNRPRVRTWSVLSTTHGNRSELPAFATREADLVPPAADLTCMAQAEREKQQNLIAGNSSLYFHAVALDADRWEIIRYSLWRDETSHLPPDSDCVQCYSVLHVSEP